MRLLLILIFVGIFLTMTIVTTQAAMERNLLDAGYLFSDGWFRATLSDAYCGFVTFYCWVFYKERRVLPRLLWFAAIMLLGNFAMSGYVLWQLARLAPERPLWHLLLRRDHLPELPAGVRGPNS